MSARPAVARTQLQYAAVLLAAGQVRQRTRALELLDEAVAIARELELAPLLAQAEALLGAVRGRTGRSAALTPRERDVAALVARGLSNREIAETLTIGERTVEMHVSHVLTKLDLPSRTAVAVWAVQHGLTTSRP